MPFSLAVSHDLVTEPERLADFWIHQSPREVRSDAGGAVETAYLGTVLFDGEKNLGAAAAVAVMRRKERDLREVFFARGAIQPIDARSLTDLGLEENMTWKRMCRRSVIRESSPGLFYWDEDVWQALRSTRLRMAMMMIGAIILVGAVIAYGSTQLK